MIEYFVYHYGTLLLGAILCAIFGCLGFSANKAYKTYINKQNDRIDTDTKISIARTVAKFVEQAWKTLHGPEKLRKALKTAEILLKKKGITFDADEMMVLIEAAVAEFNEAFKSPLLNENAKATRRIDNDPAAEAVTE